MGNIGAYIGELLGYSALQIPELIQLISRHLKKYLAKRRSVIKNLVPNTTQIQIKEALPTNISQLSITTNPNSDVLRKIQLELEHMSQRFDTLETFTHKMNEKLEEYLDEKRMQIE